MSDTFTLKTGDSLPLFTADLDTDLSAVDEVRFYVEFPREDELIVNDLMTVVDVTGEVEYQFTESETAYNGSHYGEIRVTYSNGDIESFPKRGFYELDFTETVDRNVSVTSSEEDLTLTHLDAEKINTESVVVHTESKHNDDVPALYGTDGDISFTFDPTAGAQVLRDEAGSQDLLVAQLSGDISASGTQLYDATNGVVPQSTLGGPASSLSVYPLDGVDIADGAISRSHLSPSFYTQTEANAEFLEDVADGVARSNIAPSIYTQSEADTEFLTDAAGTVARSNIAPTFYTQSEANSAFIDASGDSISGKLEIHDTENQMQLFDSNAADPNDHYMFSHYDGTLALNFYDDSAASSTPVLKLINDGNIEIPNGDLNLNNNSIKAAGNIYADGNESIRTSGGGSSFWQFYDRFNSQKIAVFNEGGNVGIPNGTLDVAGEGSIAGTTAGVGIASHLKFTGDQRIHPQIRTPGGGGQSIYVTDDANGQTIAQFLEGGNVDIPSGDVMLGANINFTGDTDTTPAILSPGIDGTHNIRIWDQYNAQAIIDFQEGGNVDIPNGKIEFSRTIGPVIQKGLEHNGLYTESATADQISLRGRNGLELATYDGTTGTLVRDLFTRYGDVTIPNGSLTISDGGLDVSGVLSGGGGTNLNVVPDGDLILQTPGGGGGRASLYDRQNSQRVLNAVEGGNVEIPNGHAEIATGVEHRQRANDPSTSELAAGQNMTYASDGSTGVTGAAGDLVYAVNDAGTILTTVVAAKSNAT